MTCCGPTLVETTDQDDIERVYLCPICGKQGGETAFPEPPTPFDNAPPAAWREKLAAWLYRLADWILR